LIILSHQAMQYLAQTRVLFLNEGDVKSVI